MGTESEVSENLAITTEAGIKRSIGVVAGHGEVVTVANAKAIARRQYLAIALHCDAVDVIVTRSDVRGNLAITTECCIKRSIGVVAGQAEPFIAAVIAFAPHQYLAIALHCDAVAVIVMRSEVRGNLAITTEAGIKLAIHVVADQGEIPIAVCAIARHQYPAIALHCDAVAGIATR